VQWQVERQRVLAGTFSPDILFLDPTRSFYVMTAAEWELFLKFADRVFPMRKP